MKLERGSQNRDMVEVRGTVDVGEDAAESTRLDVLEALSPYRPAGVLVAVETIRSPVTAASWDGPGGTMRIIGPAMTFDPSHPWIKEHPELFGPLQVRLSHPWPEPEPEPYRP